ncbi:MAG: hypothetical protein H7A18_12585 [Sinobacteraceae bacterium]|nr:hypothetical protein [Nevskiaceae bacterium]MCP5472888.1 hypothetical protein [Nevskiaceae bacterium]
MNGVSGPGADASMPPTAIHRLVEAARAGDPAVIARLPSGWAMFGRQQFLRGYALLLPDPVVPHLNALPAAQRACFLDDMVRLGDALLAATGALRINYAMFGNLEPALHAHLVPRYADEPEALRGAHPWAYDWGAAPAFDAAALAPLAAQLRARLGVAADGRLEFA